MNFVRSLSDYQLLRTRQGWEADSLVGVCIGNFDGLHLGHCKLYQTLDAGLDRLAAKQAGVKLRKVLFTFYPHPRVVLSGISRKDRLKDSRFAEITSIRERAQLAAEMGFDIFFAARFSKKFSAQSPEDFIEQYLINLLSARLLVVGHDWAFGKGRSGDAQYLKELGKRLGFQTEIVAPVKHLGQRISSSMLRERILAGDMRAAHELCGRYFSLSGKVLRGQQLGRKLGVPTANMRFSGRILPKDGVYATLAQVDGELFRAVSSIGVRPSVESSGERLLETHILDDFAEELYGKRVEIKFVQFLREEKKFEQLEDLVTAMHQDICLAEEVLSESI